MNQGIDNPEKVIGEIKMQDPMALEDSQDEMEKEEPTHFSEQEDMEVDIKALIVIHGEKEVNNM